ncbi:MAG: methyltransferase [Lasallia pustulata]|uniref:Methyltransferase n=1 Tax=Lasallia pustulata TaxID=136370 RepID=A0A5M8Q2Y4_9LECA|nr:MAG: methyltransferase [Lasallia pustulata]
MTHRALSLLSLRTPSLILDIGCGSGLSGEILSLTPPSAGGPHIWIGMDISASMLDVALQRDVDGDLLLADMGQGVPVRAGAFDAAISISAIQWLCNAESSEGMSGVEVVDARRRGKEKGKREERKGGKAWILRKKEQMERKGKVVKASSKYTGRKRGPKF